jgi:patatin-like phospholipase/acyl hydrolase
MALEVESGSGELCRVLSLDGGGAKGFYTLGILKELEGLLGGPLCEHFNLIFGTSTGAIIAALLALGHDIETIHGLYKQYVPTIMRGRNAKERSAALAHLTKVVFGEKTFLDARTGIGIVATHWVEEKPMIFKTSIAQAHGRQGTFTSGFGCTVGDAVRASCSAYPFFKRPVIKTNKGDHVELVDGGYSANNPTLYAIADALIALKRPPESIRVLSLGVGNYPEPKPKLLKRLKRRIDEVFLDVQLLQKTLNINTASMEQLRWILYKDTIRTVRINDTFEKPEMATDLLEWNLKKLDILYQRGSESFAKREIELRDLLK